MQRRGRHKIFLGMAAGVGKTYRMLQEGQAEAEAGRDVVIGYLEPHARPDTIARAEHLELVPRRAVRYRSGELAEMDVAAVVARAPELALVDELAHTNAPGAEHAKRFEDVEEVLRAGIDVLSTVNVQHLESLNDQVAGLTGVTVRETLPDDVLGRADEVVIVDLTPEALIARMQAGKIYPLDRVAAALNGFFKIENLAALREIALLQVAEEVEAKRLVHEVVARDDDRLIQTAAAPQAVAERLLALVRPEPSSQRIVRRAWRSAQRLGAALDVLWVGAPEREPTPQQREQLDALRRLTSVLGAHLLVEHGDLVETVRRVAGDRGTTYVLLGAPSRRRGTGRLRDPLAIQLIDALPGIDVRIVADRSRRGRR